MVDDGAPTGFVHLAGQVPGRRLVREVHAR
jgi:hypothetical protein